MKKVLMLVAAGLLLTASAALARPQKVDVCHIPPNNPANAHAISVSTNAVPAHLGHGDYLLDASGICCAVYPRCLWNAQDCAQVRCPARCAAACPMDRTCYNNCMDRCLQSCRAFLRQCVADNCP
jgi:hypothetical protein